MKDFTQHFLESKSWWFNCTPQDDKYIVETYGELLYEKQQYPCHHGILKQIILFDQIPRHIERHTKDVGYKHIIDFYLFTKAYPLAIEYLKYEQCKKAIELCFMLLPLRHTKNTNDHFLAIQIAWNALDEKRYQDTHHIKMFLKASYKRSPRLKGDDVNTLIFKEKPATISKQAYLDLKDIAHILDQRSFEEKCMMTPKKINEISLKIRKTMSDFLTHHNLKNSTIVVSLSGGVDSMVCGYVLALLRRDFNLTIKYVHINYMNREYTLEEEVFLTKWSNWIGSDLYIRRIHEINRQQCSDFDLRDTYESYTKDVRFDTYRYVCAANPPLIMLGHNEGDCFENIFTNIINQSHYDDLDGMLPISMINNVCLLRPFLQTTKHEIYDYARSMNIPFLMNSTPSWSQRGKIRDSIVPVLNAFNINAITSILHLSKEVKDVYAMVSSFAAMYFSKFVEVMPNEYSYMMNINDLQTSSILWSGVLRHVKIRVSHKALDVLNSELEQFKERFTTLENRHVKRITVNKYTQIKVEKKQMICVVSIIVNTNTY